MIFANELLKLISKEEIEVFGRVDELMREARKNHHRAPDIGFNCHSICRALVLEISDGSISVVDGDYVGIEIFPDRTTKLSGAAHSWLATRQGNIIDPYPFGVFCASPLLLVKGGQFTPFTVGRYFPTDLSEDFDREKAESDARTLQALFHAREVLAPV